jgi:hypothetical protein
MGRTGHNGNSRHDQQDGHDAPRSAMHFRHRSRIGPDPKRSALALPGPTFRWAVLSATPQVRCSGRSAEGRRLQAWNTDTTAAVLLC